jgi:hypothetical protein
MRPAKFTRFFLIVAGAAISAGAFAGTAAADHRDSRSHQEKVFPKATYPRSEHLSRGRHGGGGGGNRNQGYARSVVAVPIIVAAPVVYPAQYPYYVQQHYVQQQYPQQPYFQQPYPSNLTPHTNMCRHWCPPITSVDEVVWVSSGL